MNALCRLLGVAAGLTLLLGLIAGCSAHSGQAGTPHFTEVSVARMMGAPVGQAVPALRYRRVTDAGWTNMAPGYYGPREIRHAYGLDTTYLTGAGQTIALVEAYGPKYETVDSDFAAFCTQFKLPQTTVTTVYVGGSRPPNPGGCDNWGMETRADMQYAHAIAPAAKLLIVYAQSQSIADMAQAIDYAGDHANIVSMSFGMPEFASMTQYEHLFTKPGVIFVNSSGDSGAGVGVQWPAASPNVISVGGTTLHLSDIGEWQSEVGWSGSGGGQSHYFPRPAFQDGFVTANARQIPDVCYNADPATSVYVYDTTFALDNSASPWGMVGGTSMGAPQWAGLLALMNTSSAAPTTSAGVLAKLYAIAQQHADAFHDITSGSNGIYTAAAGCDAVTGLGSPSSAALLPQLASIAPPMLPAALLSASLPAVTAGYPLTLSWSATNAATLVASNFPANALSGTLQVQPTQTTTYSYTVRSAGGQEATASVTVTVLPAPTVAITASRTRITAGQPVTLSWSSTNVNGQCFISTSVNGAISSTGVANSGIMTVTPSVTTTYYVLGSETVQRPTDLEHIVVANAQNSVTVTVDAPVPTLHLTASSTAVTAGQPVTLTWTSANAATVTASNFGANALSGTAQVTPTVTTTYTLTVSGPGGSVTATVLVHVATPAPAPTITLTPSATTITHGQLVKLSWTSTQATAVTASNFDAPASVVSGGLRVWPDATKTYTITVIGPGGNATATATVTVQ